MPGSFVPTVTAITTSQDLQWLVQPTLISSMAQSQGQPLASQPPAVDPYDMPGTSYSTPGLSAYSAGGASGSGGPSTSTASGAPGPARPARARPRRSREETVSKRPREEPGDVGSVGSVPASRGDLQRSMNQEWSCRLVTLALGRWRQEDQGFEASLCSLLSLRPAWTARDYY